MARSQSRVKASAALSLAVAVTALLAASASLLVAPPRALAYYGRPNIADSYETSATYSCQQVDPSSSMQTGGFAMAADGSMWLAENDSNFVSNGRSALVHLAGSGLLINTTPLPSQYTGLGGAAFGPDGKLYITCKSTQSVLVYDLPTMQVVSQIGDSSVFDTPVDLEFDRNGNLFVVDPFGHISGSIADGQVVRYNSTFTSHTAFNAESSPYGALSFPHGLCVDALNDVWVADSVNNRVIEFDNSGTALTEVRPQDAGTDALSSPQDVYIDVYNTLYIVDQKDFGDAFASGRFVRYSPDGTFLGEYRTKAVGYLNNPTKIWLNSPVFNGDVFVDDQITDTGQGVAGLVERWQLDEINPDVTPPTTTIVNPPVGWQHGTQQIALSAEDTQSGVASTVWGYSAGSLSSYTSTITVAAEGTTTIYYRSADTSGNVEPLNNFQVKIDRNAPQTTAVGIPNPPIFYTTPTGSLATSDSVSGVQNTFWRTDGGQWFSGTSLVLPSALGTHTLDYYSTDVSGLTETTHTVTYQVLNHTEQDDGRVLNQGAWSSVTTAAAFGGSYGTAAASGARSLVTFKGTRLDYYATTGPAFGKANVRIDGGAVTPVDLYTSSLAYRKLVWSTGQVPDATHTVEIAWSGAKNSSSTSATVNVDAFDTIGFVGMADTDPPSTAAQYAPSNALTNWVRPDLTVTLTASDTVSGVDHTYYSTDNTTPTLVYSTTLTLSSDGVTTLKYRSVDRVGNAEPIHTATLRVDGTAPTTTCTVLPSYASSATIMLVPTDAGSGLAQTRYSLDGSAATSGTVVVTSAIGSHTLAFASTDIAGNVEPTQTVSFDVLSQNDQTNPMAYYRGPWSTGPLPGSFGGTTASLNAAGGAYFSFTGTRMELRSVMGPNMGQAQVNIDGAPAGTVDYYASTTGVPVVVFSATGLASTTHTVQLIWLGTKNAASSGTTIGLDALDLLGNLVADTQPPTTLDNTDGVWHRGTVPLILTPSDVGSWVATTYASINGSTTVYSGPVDITAEGTTTVQYWSVDGAGNKETTHTVQVFVDNGDPNSWDNLPITWQHAPITVTLSANDSESGVQKILYTVGLSAETLYTAPFVVSQEGSIPVEYYAVDKASNTESLHTSYALVDLTSPITTDNAPVGWVKNPVDVSLIATDAYSGVAQTLYGLNGAAPSIVATSPIHIATEGTTTIAYRSTDVAGNVESTRTTIVRFDATAPVTTSNAMPSYASTGTVILTPTDSASGVALTQWRVDSGSWTTGTVATLPLVAGQHVLQWASTDVAGNIETTRSATYQMMQRWEQTDSRLYFKGSWATSSSLAYSGGSMVSVNATSSSLFFNFTGTRFDLIGSSGPAFGYAKVTVDGTNMGNADFYSATPADKAVILSTAGLANASHVVRIDWTGTKNAASTGTAISVDAIDLIGQLTSDTVAPVTTSDANAAWRATNATITLTANDANSYVANSFYRIASTTTTYTAPIVISAEGTTGIQFWSVDGAGNVETSTAASVRIDKTAPVTSDDSTSTWQKGPVNVHLTSTDSLSGVAAIYFSLDGSNPSRVATGGLVTISAEGTTTLKYKAVDAVGNTESVKTATIRIDNTTPGTANNASPSWVKAPAVVTLTASDTLSGIAKTYYSTDGSNPTLVASGPLNISADGTTTLKYYSLDNAGNSETTKSVAVKVDAAAPVTTATVQPEYSGSATITLSATDSESGLASTHWRLDGSAWATGSVATTSTGGTHLLEFYSVDAVGNVESIKSATFDLAVRTESSALSPTPKSVWTTSTASGDSAGSERYTTYKGAYCAFTFKGTGFHLIARKDSYGGTGTITVDGNATYTVNFYNATTQYQQTIQTVTGLPDEQHIVTLTCSNSLGKRVHFDAVDLIGYLTSSADNSPPITVDNTDGLWHNTPFAFALTADDTQHNVANTYYSLNGGDLQSYVGTFTISTDGTNTVDYYSVDSKGNTEATNTADVLIDQSAPVSASDVATGWLSAPTTVHLSATDPYSGVAGTRYSVNGSAAATYTTGIGVAAEGTTTIAYASVDNVGNVEATKTATVRLDFTAPVTTSNAATSYVNTATITLSPTDSGAGVAQTLWRVDGSAWTSGTVATVTTAGTHSLDYYSTDGLGHAEATKTATFDVLKRFEQTDSRLTWTGSWSLVTNAGLSGGDVRNSNTASSCVYATFTGSRVDWIGSRNTSYGQARVTLDGGTPTIVDLYGSFAFQQRLWSSGDLANGVHTLKIETPRSHNTSATDYWVSVDALDIRGALVADTFAPVTAASGNSSWTTAPVTVSLTAADLGTWVAGTYYRLASGQTTTYTAPFTVSAEGTTPVSYWSTDGAGNTESPHTLNVRIDRTAPSTTDNAPTQWVPGPLLVSLNSFDAASGVAATYYSTDGGAPAQVASQAISISAEGSTTLRYYSVDNAGNVETETLRTVRVDNTPPTSTSDAPSGWVNGPVTLHLSAADNLSGVAGIRYSIDGAIATTCTGPITVTDEGTSTVSWAAVDLAGNVEPTRTATLLIDNTAPATTDSVPSTWASAPLSVTLNASDSVSGIASTYYSLDGTTPTVPYSGPIVIAADGVTSLKYFSVDNEGNIESVHTSYAQLDSTAPTSSDDAPKSWVQGPVSVNIAATDTVSGVAQTLYSTDGNTPSIPVSGPITFSKEGTSTLSYCSRDVRGNLEPVKSTLVRIDNTPPSTPSNAQSSYLGTATVTFSASDGLSGVASTLWRLDGAAWSNGSSATITAGGHHTLEWHSTDVAGNVEATQSAQFDLSKRIDDTDQAFVWQGAWSTPTNAALYGGSYHSANSSGSSAFFTFTGTGFTWITSKSTDFGIASVSIDGGVATDVDLYSSVTPYQQKAFTASHLVNGVHIVRIDWTGRKNPSSSNTKIGIDAADVIGTAAHDTLPPTTTSNIAPPWSKGPVSVVLSATDDQNFVAATYYQLNAGATTTYTVPFPVSAEGTNSVSFWSVDGAGNLEATESAVVRIDNTPPVTTDDAPTGWVAIPTTLHLTPSDALSGPVATVFTVNGSAVATYAGSIPVTAEGTNTIAYASFDAAGNLEPTRTAQVKLDFSAPVTTATVSASYTNTATIPLTATDAGSGVAQTLWRIDGSAWTTGSVATTTSPGAHTLSFYSVDNLGHAEIPKSVQFDLYHRYEQTDSTLIWTGTWSTLNNAGLSGGSAKTSNTATSSMYATFSGSRITWIGSRNTSYGQARVSLDGGAPVTVDTYGSFAFQQKLWDSGDLSNATHTLRIDVPRSKNASATDYTVSLDAFDVRGTLSGDVVPPSTTASLTANSWSSVPVTISLSAADSGSWVANTYYKLSGGQTTTYTAPFSVSAEGTTSVSYWSVDGVGNVESSKSVDVKIDRTMPSTNDDAPSGWTRGPVSVNLTATDAVSGVASTLYSTDGSAPSLACNGPVVLSAEGTQTLRYYSIDRAGNAEAPKSKTLLIDNTAPTSFDDAPVSGWTPALVHVSATDGLSGVAGVRYSVNGSSLATYVAGIPLAQDGTNTIMYQAVDNVGNVESAHTIVVKADSAPPSTSCNAVSSYYATASITLTATDTVSGVANTSYTLDGGALTSGTALTVSTAGHHTLTYSSTDRAGNVEPIKTASFDIYRRYEQTDSNVLFQGTWTLGSSTSLSGGSWLKINTAGGAANVSFVGTGLDLITSKASSLGKAKITVDGASPTTVDLYSASTLFQQKVWSVAGLSNALHTVRIEWTGSQNASSTGAWVGVDAFDIAGSLVQVPDSMPPTTTCSADALWHTSASVTVTMTATDNLTGVASTNYKLDGSAAASYTAPITISTDGAHTLQYWSVDARGNVEPTHSTQVLVDHTSPTTTSTVVPSYAATASISLLSTDSASGVASTQYRLDAGAWVTGSTLSTSAPGVHTLDFRSTDVAGNVEATKTVMFGIKQRVEQTDSRLGYVGTWSTVSNGGLSGGSYVYANAIGAAANLTFTGTRVDWISSKSTNYGQALVSVDGSVPTTISLYASAPAFQQSIWSSGNLAGGTHTLRIEWLGSKDASSSGTSVGIDALDVFGTPATATASYRYEQTDSRLAPLGTWSTVTHPSLSAGSYTYTNALGGAAAITFVGTRLNWVTSRSTSYGQATVSIDGTTPVTVDLYAGSAQFQQNVWTTGNLPFGAHSVRIEWTGSKNASSTGTAVGIDALDVTGVLTKAPSTARYEETDPRIALVGTWANVANAGLSAGVYKSTQTLGSSANVTFVGSGVNWITSKAANFGIAKVVLDGGTPQSVDLYSPSAKFQQNVWSATGLAYGQHTLRIEWTGTKNTSSTDNFIGIDAIEINGVPTQAKQAYRYEQTDPLVAWQGQWQDIVDVALSGGSYRNAVNPGAVAYVNFTGSAIDWITSKAANFGIANLILDGGTPQQVDLYSPTAKFQQAVWSASGLTFGPHTLRIEYTGTKNPSSTGPVIGADAFDVTGALTQAKAATRYEETDTRLKFTGSWVAKSDPALSAGAYKSSVATGDLVSVAFTGTGIDWIGSKTSRAGTATVSVDGGAPVTVDLSSATAQFQAKVFSAQGLTDGPHTLSITATSLNAISVDAFDVAGILTQAP